MMMEITSLYRFKPMYTEYSKYYQMIDDSKYEFKEDGIYSKRYNKKINGYVIGQKKKYYQTRLMCTDGQQHNVYVHVALWMHFNGEIPDNMELNHKDQDTSNNVLQNLELMTHKANINYGTAQERRVASFKNTISKRKKEGS